MFLFAMANSDKISWGLAKLLDRVWLVPKVQLYAIAFATISIGANPKPHKSILLKAADIDGFSASLLLSHSLNSSTG